MSIKKLKSKKDLLEICLIKIKNKDFQDVKHFLFHEKGLETLLHLYDLDNINIDYIRRTSNGRILNEYIEHPDY